MSRGCFIVHLASSELPECPNSSENVFCNFLSNFVILETPKLQKTIFPHPSRLDIEPSDENNFVKLVHTVLEQVNKFVDANSYRLIDLEETAVCV